jgi:hypothetical protein
VTEEIFSGRGFGLHEPYSEGLLPSIENRDSVFGKTRRILFPKIRWREGSSPNQSIFARTT